MMRSVLSTHHYTSSDRDGRATLSPVLKLYCFVAMLLTLGGCSSTRTLVKFDPEKNPEKAIVFGRIRVVIVDAKTQAVMRDVTNGSSITFSGGDTLELDSTGFVAAQVTPGRSYIERFNLAKDIYDYVLPNLGLRTGAARSRTYMGDITIMLENPTKKNDPYDFWSWKVENRADSAILTWKKKFEPSAIGKRSPAAEKKNKGVFHLGLAQKIGPDRLRSRDVPSGRQEVNPGF